MTDEIEIEPPPMWSIKEAVRRLASAAAKRDVQLDDVTWALGRYGDEEHKSVAYTVKGVDDKVTVVDLATVTAIAFNIAATAN